MAGQESETSRHLQAAVPVYDHVEISAFPGIDHLLVVRATKQTVEFLLSFFYYQHDTSGVHWAIGDAMPAGLASTNLAVHRSSLLGTGLGPGAGAPMRLEQVTESRE